MEYGKEGGHSRDLPDSSVINSEQEACVPSLVRELRSHVLHSAGWGVGRREDTLKCSLKKKKRKRDLPGGPVAKTLRSQCRGPSLIPGQGTRSHMPQLRCSTANK